MENNHLLTEVSEIAGGITKDKFKDMAEFMKMATHELKTPVTTAKVYLHLLAEHFKKYGERNQTTFAFALPIMKNSTHV